jgi:NICE-3 protein
LSDAIFCNFCCLDFRHTNSLHGTKNVKRETERRLDVVDKLYFEPQLLATDDKFILKPGSSLPPYYYRMRAVDDIKILEKEIPIARGKQTLRSFLLNYLNPNGSSQKLIHQFCDCYEAARHDPAEFGDEEYQKYHHLLMKIIET